MNKQLRAELLSPCGNFDCVTAAVNAGADAVYLGGQLFNARAYASNFDLPALEKTVDLCHSFGVKVYVTVNTLYKDTEFPELIPFITELYAMGANGLIMQDIGAIRLVRKYIPDLPVHASTQLTANCLEDVKAMEALGIRTVVLSRELNLDEIRNIAANTSVRIETFIHGALCVSYSGQCLMSSVLGNRSGNRGKCAQNCRLNYELIRAGSGTAAAGHLLSTKDICTLELLPDLLDSGVASLKIEGRMKSLEYVAGVTGIYRKYLDMYYAGEPYAVDPKDTDILRQLFNRGSFSTGYLKTHSGSAMMCPAHPRAWGVRAGKVLSYDAKKHLAVILPDRELVPGDGIEIRTDPDEGTGCYVEQACPPGGKLALKIEGPIVKNQEVWQTYDKRLMDSLKPQYEGLLRKVPLTAHVLLRPKLPSCMTVSANGLKINVKGEIPTAAKNQPLTRETVTAQLSKLGNTIYQAEHIEVDMEDGLFLNRSDLNALKNKAAEALTQAAVNSAKRHPEPIDPDHGEEQPASGPRSLTVLVRTADQFRAALASPSVSIIFSEMSEEMMAGLEAITAAAHEQGKKFAVRLPRIFRAYVQDRIAPLMERCRTARIDGWLISNLGHYQAVKDSGKSFYLDFTGNVMNSSAVSFWREIGAETAAVSVEMSREEVNRLRDRSRIELTAYGRIPLMVTHQCPVGNFAGNKQDRIFCGKRFHAEQYQLRSGKDVFDLETDCRDCVCTVMTAAPLDIRQDIFNFDVSLIRLNFTNESAAETEAVIRRYEKILASGKASGVVRENIYDKSVL